MSYYLELVRHFPLQALAGGIVPLIQYTGHKLGTRRSEHRKRQLREKVIALNAFISSVGQGARRAELQEACLQDALHEGELALEQLAALATARGRRARLIIPRGALQRRFLLYSATRPAGWVLRWIFFTLVITAIAATIRGLLGISYLPIPELVLFVIGSLILAALARMAVLRVERRNNSAEMQAARAS